MSTSEGRSKCFGFVSFEEAEQAEAAVAHLHGTEVEEGKRLFVGRAQKKAARNAELKKRFDRIKMERISRFCLGAIHKLRNTLKGKGVATMK